jgi:hypothetical protein
MRKTVCTVVSVLLVFALVPALAGCGVLSNAAELEQYEIGEDVIPSINSIVGEREVTGVESSTDNGVKVKQYTYASTSVFDDLLQFVTRLREEGWLVTQDIDLEVVPGAGELGKNSVDEGQIVLVDFSYDESGYTIKISKGEGTIEAD